MLHLVKVSFFSRIDTCRTSSCRISSGKTSNFHLVRHADILSCKTCRTRKVNIDMMSIFQSRHAVFFFFPAEKLDYRSIENRSQSDYWKLVMLMASLMATARVRVEIAVNTSSRVRSSGKIRWTNCWFINLVFFLEWRNAVCVFDEDFWFFVTTAGFTWCYIASWWT